MNEQDHDAVVADLVDVYASATANARAAAQSSRDPRLSLIERLRHRHQAQKYQELAEQARRMINELTPRAAA